MKNPIARIVSIVSLLLAVTVPFAGLAPLILFLLFWLVGSAFWELLRSLFPAHPAREGEFKETRKKSA